MSLLMEFYSRQGGVLSTIFNRECIIPRSENMQKIMLLNQKCTQALRCMFQSMKAEIYLPVEVHPYPRKRQQGRILFYRPNDDPVVRLSLSFGILNLLYKFHLIRMPIHRLHVDNYTTMQRVEQFVAMFEECVEELVWKSNDAKRALKFISACPSSLKYLECDINLLDSPDFPQLKLNKFKSIKVKANSDQVMSSLWRQEVRCLDLSNLSSSNGSSFTQSLLRSTVEITPQKSLESVSLRFQVCQAKELFAKVIEIKQFAPNLRQVEFVRNTNGIEFDSDLSHFIFLEIEQMHNAVKSAQMLSVRCSYTLHPEECFNFRASASLIVVCNMTSCELNWRPPRSTSGKQMFRRREQMTFQDSNKVFRAFVYNFVAQMEKEYRQAEYY